MKKYLLGSILTFMIFLLSGCMGGSTMQAMMYDLGPMEETSQVVLLPNTMPYLLATKVSSAEWLNSSLMYYRLGHVNEQQTRAYSESRWNRQPAKIFRDRLQSRIIAARNETNSVKADGARLEIVLYLEDFSQYFYDETKSEARIVVRATLLRDGVLLDQKIFTQKEPAPSADAAGGVKALAVATEDVISEILVWTINRYQS